MEGFLDKGLRMGYLWRGHVASCEEAEELEPKTEDSAPPPPGLAKELRAQGQKR